MMKSAIRNTGAMILVLAISIGLLPCNGLSDPVESNNLDGTNTVKWDFSMPVDYYIQNVSMNSGTVMLSEHELGWVQDNHSSFNSSWGKENLNVLPEGGIELQVNQTVQLLKNGEFHGPGFGAYNWTTFDYGNGGFFNGQSIAGGMSDNGDCWVSWFWDFSDIESYTHSVWVNQTVNVPSVPLAINLSAFHNFTTTAIVTPGTDAMLFIFNNQTSTPYLIDQTGSVNETYSGYRYLGTNSTTVFDAPGNYTLSLFTYTDSSDTVDTITQVENYWDNASMLFTAYKDHGSYTSKVLNAGSFAMWKNISWEEELPYGTDIEFFVRTGNSSVPTDSIWSNWSQPCSEPSGSAIDRPWGQYLQYRVEFRTNYTNVTPVLNMVNITYGMYHLDGVVETQDFVPANLVRWGFFCHSEARNGQSVRFQYSTDSGLAWSDIPFENDLRSVSVVQGKIRFRAILNTTDTVVTPHLFSMELDYVSLSPAFTLEPEWDMNGASPGDVASLFIHFNNTASSRSATAWLNIYLDDRLEYISNNSETLPIFQSYISDTNSGIRKYVFEDIAQGQNLIWIEARVKSGTIDGEMLSTTITLDYLGPIENRVESLLVTVPLRVNGPAMSADLMIYNTSADVGDIVEYGYWLNNSGRGSASKVWVNATVDDRLEIENRTWSYDSLPQNSARLVLFNATMKSTVSQGSSIPLSLALAYSDNTGYTVNKGAGQVQVIAKMRSQIDFMISSPIEKVNSSDMVVLTVHYNNIGYGSADSVKFRFKIPEGLEFISSSEECLVFLNSCYWEFLDVGPGTHSFTMTLRALKLQNAEVSIDDIIIKMQVLDPIDGQRPEMDSNSVSISIFRVYTFWEKIYWPWSGLAIGLGISFAIFALWYVFKPIPPSIDDVFVLYKDGRLITHRQSGKAESSGLDGDLVGAMLTAVQQFITDSLSNGKSDRVKKLEFGEKELFLERGENINLAIVYTGSMNKKLQAQMLEITHNIEKAHPELVSWDGRMRSLDDITPLIDGFIGQWQSQK
jgi:hypothetical protein